MFHEARDSLDPLNEKSTISPLVDDCVVRLKNTIGIGLGSSKAYR